MFGLKMICQGFGAALLLTTLMANPCSGQFTNYVVMGRITEVIENENGVIPNLPEGSVSPDAVGFGFTAQLRYNIQGWDGTPGRIAINLRGTELVFEGDSVFGGITGDPNYSYRIVADQVGAEADIRNSNFLPINFGLELAGFEDSTFGFNETELAFNPAFAGEYETNRFTIEGTMRDSEERVNVIGFVDSVIVFGQNVDGDVDDDDDADIDDINQFPDALGESALFFGDFDLDQDGVITLADHDMLINDFVTFSTGTEPNTVDFTGTLVGDINFDGCVDVLGDAFVLVASLGGPGPFGYQDGDLNADNLVTVLGDAFRLVANLGRSIK